MALVRWKERTPYDPWADLQKLQSEINDLFDVGARSENAGLFDRSVSPPVDIIESEHDFSIICELPGLEQKDIDLSITSNIITIKGEKKGKNELKEKGKLYKKESWSGSFQRTLSMPESIDSEKIKAELSNGILTINVLKKEEMKAKQIAVKVK